MALTFQGSFPDPVNRTTYTFAAMPIGAAAADRRVIAVLSRRDGTSLVSVTIGGVAATIDHDASPTGVNDVIIASAVVPTGTTADIVMALSAPATRAGVGVWTGYSVAPTGEVGTDVTNPFTNLTVNTAVGDDLVAAVIWVGGDSPVGKTWSSGTTRYSEALEGTVAHSGADAIASGSTFTFGISPAASGIAAAAAYREVSNLNLAGAAVVISTASGTVLAQRTLAGQAVASAAASGDMLAQRTLDGAAAASSAASGALLARRVLTGSATATTAAAGTLGIARPLAGDAVIVSAASGALLARRALAGSPVMVTSVAEGSLLARRSLAGSVAVTVTAEGTLALPPRSTRVYFRGERVDHAYHLGDAVTLR